MDEREVVVNYQGYNRKGSVADDCQVGKFDQPTKVTIVLKKVVPVIQEDYQYKIMTDYNQDVKDYVLKENEYTREEAIFLADRIKKLKVVSENMSNTYMKVLQYAVEDNKKMIGQIGDLESKVKNTNQVNTELAKEIAALELETEKLEKLDKKVDVYDSGDLRRDIINITPNLTEYLSYYYKIYNKYDPNYTHKITITPKQYNRYNFYSGITYFFEMLNKFYNQITTDPDDQQSLRSLFGKTLKSLDNLKNVHGKQIQEGCYTEIKFPGLKSAKKYNRKIDSMMNSFLSMLKPFENNDRSIISPDFVRAYKFLVNNLDKLKLYEKHPCF